MRVETAAAEDIRELTDLRLEYLREDFGALDAGTAAAIRERLPDYFRAHLGRDLFACVIRADDAIASCAFLLVVEKPMSPAFPNGRTGTVLNVYTRPPFRRRGYARDVVRALLAVAEEQALSTVELKATDDGYPLYRSVGFADNPSKHRPMKWKPQ